MRKGRIIRDVLTYVCSLACAVPLAALLLVALFDGLYQAYRRKTHGHPVHWLRTRLGRGLGTDELARRLSVEVDTLTRIAAGPVYHRRAIPKRRGGWRTLWVPNHELRQLQRRILYRLLKRLRTHPCCMGFEPGRSIVHNAAAHAGKAVVIKMDIVDFFPTTSAARVEAYFRRIGWNAQAASLLTRLTTHDGGLPIGAPTSPRLSNLLNFALDSRIERFVVQRNGCYTRYADDITISFARDRPKRIRGTIFRVKRMCVKFGYAVHTQHKLRVLRRHQQQRVTGLVVNHQADLPRRTRRWLRAVEHRLRTTGVATLTDRELAGWRALQQMIRTQRSRISERVEKEQG